MAVGGPVRNKLGIIPGFLYFSAKLHEENVTWGGQSGSAGAALYGDFLKPAFHNVDALLDAGYQVAVYNGQYDLVVDILCTQQWIQVSRKID